MLWLSLACAPPVERASGPLPDGAYVWQRQWTEDVRGAVTDHGPELAHLWLLAAEVSWEGARARVHRVDLDRVEGAGLVVRIAVPPADVDLVAATGDLLRDLARHGPSEIQVDVDWPTRRLDEVPPAVRGLRAAVAPVPLTVTALASWLDEDPAALREVAAAADGWVLQLHWLDPDRADGSVLDPRARDHVEAAAALGLPFRAALPTYRYQVARDAAGAVTGIAAEQGRLRPAADGEVTTFAADPAEVAALVRSLRADRPALLEQIAWFRLPVEADRQAWAWPTLAAVRAGRAPAAAARIAFERQPRGAWTVRLHNDGDADLALPEVRLRSAVEIADAVGGYRWDARERVFVPPVDALRPGGARVVGWVRAAERPALAEQRSGGSRTPSSSCALPSTRGPAPGEHPRGDTGTVGRK